MRVAERFMCEYTGYGSGTLICDHALCVHTLPRGHFWVSSSSAVVERILVRHCVLNIHYWSFWLETCRFLKAPSGQLFSQQWQRRILWQTVWHVSACRCGSHSICQTVSSEHFDDSSTWPDNLEVMSDSLSTRSATSQLVGDPRNCPIRAF